jgi:mannose-6-phosphate isomerase-like protein (cupin superfamily)
MLFSKIFAMFSTSENNQAIGEEIKAETFFDKPYHENRPWGNFETFCKNTQATVKIISVNPGEYTSLQTHKNRTEFWYILSGNGELDINSSTMTATPGEYHTVPATVAHRIRGGTEILKLLEVSTGNFDENDIERLEDKYNRIKS